MFAPDPTAATGVPWGTIASVGANLVGKLFGGGKSSAEKQAQWWNAEELPRIQKDLAYNGIFHRVQDAKQSGIHPLFALGFQPSNSPSHVIGDTGSSPNIGETMGQNIGSAVNAFLGREEKLMQKRVAELQIEGAELDNAYKRAQIGLMTQGGRSSSMPTTHSTGAMPGQGDSYIDVPAENIKGMKGRPEGQGGAIPEIGYTRTSPTRLDVVMSEQYKQRAEDDIIQQLKWHGKHSVPIASRIRHALQKPPYPDVPVPPGYKRWVWASDHWKASKR